MNYALSVAFAILLGLLVTRIGNKFKLPDVTSYLIAGLLLGPCLLGTLNIPGLGFHTFEDVEILSVSSIGYFRYSDNGSQRLRLAAIVFVPQTLERGCTWQSRSSFFSFYHSSVFCIHLSINPKQKGENPQTHTIILEVFTDFVYLFDIFQSRLFLIFILFLNIGPSKDTKKGGVNRLTIQFKE